MPGPSRSLRPGQLPSGRHGLSPSYVVANQRQRILDAVAVVASERGYAGMSVEGVVAASGVSRRTFYDLFPTKADAFLEVCDLIAEELAAAVFAVYDTQDPLSVRAERCLGAALDFLVEHPVYAEVAIVQVLAAGPAAVVRRDRAMQVLAELINQAVGELPDTVRPPAAVAEAVVGGMYAILYSRLRRGESTELASLRPQLLYALLVPYMGQDEAEAARQAAERALVPVSDDEDEDAGPP